MGWEDLALGGLGSIGGILSLIQGQKQLRDQRRAIERAGRSSAVTEQRALAPIDPMQFYRPATDEWNRAYRNAQAAEWASGGKPLDSFAWNEYIATKMGERSDMAMSKAIDQAIAARNAELGGLSQSGATGAAGLYKDLPKFDYTSLMGLPYAVLADRVKRRTKGYDEPPAASTPYQYGGGSPSGFYPRGIPQFSAGNVPFTLEDMSGVGQIPGWAGYESIGPDVNFYDQSGW